MTTRIKTIFGTVAGLIIGLAIGWVIMDFLFQSESPLPELKVPIKDGIVQGYVGKYKDQPEWRTLLSRAPELRQAAIERVQERTGLKPSDPGAIVLTFRDADSDFTKKAATRVVRYRGGYLMQIRVGLDRILAGLIDLETVLTHEMTHAIMRQSMKRSYRDLPRWCREGAAVWTAEQLDQKLRLEVAQAVFWRNDPMDLLDPLTSGGKHDQGGTGYVDEGLLFEALELDCGQDCVRKTLTEIVEGKDCQEAIEASAGKPLSELRAEALRLGRERLRGMTADGGLEVVEACSALWHKDDKQAAARRLRSYLERYPDSAVAPAARLSLAGYDFTLGCEAEARKEYSNLLAGEHHFSWLGSRARYLFASKLLRAGHFNEAAKNFEIFLRDFGWEGPEIRDMASAYLGSAVACSGDPARAVELLAPVVEKLSPAAAAGAKCCLLHAHEQRGNKDAAKVLADRITQEHPKWPCEGCCEPEQVVPSNCPASTQASK